jgi:hypothetical protein
VSASVVYVGSYANPGVGSDVSSARSPHLRLDASGQSPLDRFRQTADQGARGAELSPTNWVFHVAERFRAAAEERNMAPNRWVAIPDGGLACYFFGRTLTSGGAHERVARLALDNEESVTLLLEDLRAGTHELTDEAPDHLEDLLERIAVHISG